MKDEKTIKNVTKKTVKKSVLPGTTQIRYSGSHIINKKYIDNNKYFSTPNFIDNNVKIVEISKELTNFINPPKSLLKLILLKI